MHGYIYIYLDMIYMVITLPKAGYDISYLWLVLDRCEVECGDKEAKDLGITVVDITRTP
jgi:hypothetical protein